MNIPKVAVVLFDDIFVANGTTVRASRVIEILANNYETTVINCSSKEQKRLEGLENRSSPLSPVKSPDVRTSVAQHFTLSPTPVARLVFDYQRPVV
jgi:hypothetical protein